MLFFRLLSLQTRLMFGLVLALLLTLGGAGVLSFFIAQHEAEEIFGARLATSARVLDVLVAQKVARSTLNNPIVIELPKELEAITGDDQTRFGHRYENKIAFQVWDEDQRLLVRSTSAPVLPLSPLVSGFNESTTQGKRWQVFTLQSGNTWVQVAESDEIRDELSNDLSFALITPLLMGALFLLVVAYFVVGFGLAPLQQLAAQIGRKGPDTLEDIEPLESAREVTTVANAMNQLLFRLRNAREREMRFTDAAAHELRTPLAAIKVHAENLKAAQTPEARDTSLNQLIRGLNRTQRLSEQMLTLSKVQAESQREPTEPVVLQDLLADVLGELEHNMAQKNQQFEAVGLDDSHRWPVLGQPLKLHRLFSNLIDNAIRYGEPNSTITLNARRYPGWVDISLGGPGRLVPAEQKQVITEPYVRVPGGSSDGAGLGLAIVKEILDQHGGRITVEDWGSGQGTQVTFSLPLSGRV